MQSHSRVERQHHDMHNVSFFLTDGNTCPARSSGVSTFSTHPDSFWYEQCPTHHCNQTIEYWSISSHHYLKGSLSLVQSQVKTPNSKHFKSQNANKLGSHRKSTSFVGVNNAAVTRDLSASSENPSPPAKRRSRWDRWFYVDSSDGLYDFPSLGETLFQSEIVSQNKKHTKTCKRPNSPTKNKIPTITYLVY